MRTEGKRREGEGLGGDSREQTKLGEERESRRSEERGGFYRSERSEGEGRRGEARGG